MSSAFESVSGRTDEVFGAYDDPPDDPVPLARQWLGDAEAAGAREPRSMVLSTANRTPELTSRIIAILSFGPDGPVFATHSCSRKILDLAEVPYACGFFYWRELGRQLSIGGPVVELPRADSEKAWRQRPTPLHPMSTASWQSRELDSPQRLRDEAAALAGRGVLACPDRFATYLLRPEAVEFWSVSADRLHHRLRYRRRPDGRTNGSSAPSWTWVRLQP